MNTKQKIKLIINAITDPMLRMEAFCNTSYYKNMPDDVYLRKLYKARMGKELNLSNPQTFCEKLQWLKLYDRNPEYTKMVDKYAVKKYVADLIGEKHVVPLYGVWNTFDEINFDKLPESFVLKCTHNSGGFIVCKNKSEFDFDAARKLFDTLLGINYFWASREWVYKNIKPQIIAEKYIDTLGKPESIEYKLTCFGGKVKNITICQGIAHSDFSVRTNDNYDMELNHLSWYAFYKNAKKPVEIPTQMEEIIEYAEKLSKGIPQVRVDFYIHDDTVYFGEMTFYTWGGFIKFDPPEWDNVMGKWIVLPEKSGG